MTKKIALIMGVIIALFLVTTTFTYSMMQITKSHWLTSGVYYQWNYILYLSMNEWIAFSIGIVLLLGGLKHKLLAMKIVSYLLLASIIVLFVGGLYFGFVKKPGFVDINRYINLYQNTFYLAYVGILVIFSIVSIVLRTVTKKIHLFLLVLLNIIVIAVYFKQSINFGWLGDLLSYNMRVIIYQILLNFIIYPSIILIYVLFTIMYIKEKDNKDISVEAKKPSKQEV
jgi:hypothetical protein